MITFRNPFVELGRVSVSTGSFPKHTHDEFVVSANLNGHEHVWIDGKNFEADIHTLTTYNPGQIQSSHIVGTDVLRCVSLYIKPGAFEAYFHSSFEFQKPYIVRPDLTAKLISLASDLAGPETEERCVSLLHSLFEAMSGEVLQEGRAGSSSRTRRLQDRMLGNLSVVPDLECLAESEGISPAHLVRSFHQQTGLPPLAWQMQQRIDYARRLLRTGQPIIDVALEAGFADQAHFTKAFVRFMGMTPGQFRRINF